MEHQLPYSQEAEMALLGSLLMFPEALLVVEELDVSPHDFYNNDHRLIFENMVALVEQDRILEATTLIARLNDFKVLERVGGVPYLTLLAQNSATLSSLRHYIDIVQEKAQTRSLIQVGQEIVEKGFDTTLELNDYLDTAEKAINHVTHIRRSGEMQRSKEVVQEFLDNLYKIREHGDKITGLKTGYGSLNNVTNGLQKGDLIILAARPSMGKTAFALNLALNVARYNKEGKAGIAVFSLEMPATHLISRMLSAQSSVKSEILRSGALDDPMLNDLHASANVLSGLEIYIDDSSMITMSDVFAKCRKLKSEEKLDLIVIDYIQLIASRGRSENRQQEVSEISRSLKQLAREMEVPVIALSQLSRSVEKRDVKIPQLSDLRESGSIEQDADIVMFLYREAYYENRDDENLTPTNHENQEVLVKISKHRNGALADIKLQFNPTISKFYDVVSR